MKKSFQRVLRLVLTAALAGCANSANHKNEAVTMQPRRIHITATIDGSERFIFTRQCVRWEHKQWSPPTDVRFDGKRWGDLNQTPSAWRDTSGLDLTKAHIVKRSGRDVIALETTPQGFDLYLCDSPNGAADYDVTIEIPRQQ